MGLAQEGMACWSYLRGFIIAAYVLFVSGIYNTLDSSSFFPLRLHMRYRECRLAYEQTEESDFLSFPNDIGK